MKWASPWQARPCSWELGAAQNLQALLAHWAAVTSAGLALSAGAAVSAGEELHWQEAQAVILRSADFTRAKLCVQGLFQFIHLIPATMG